MFSHVNFSLTSKDPLKLLHLKKIRIIWFYPLWIWRKLLSNLHFFSNCSQLCVQLKWAVPLSFLLVVPTNGEIFAPPNHVASWIVQNSTFQYSSKYLCSPPFFACNGTTCICTTICPCIICIKRRRFLLLKACNILKKKDWKWVLEKKNLPSFCLAG